MKIIFICLFISLQFAYAGQKAAVVKMLRGDVKLENGSKSKKLNAKDWVEEGSIIKTAARSFVKLVFVDKSQMNVGPDSEMKIESFGGKEAGVIDMVRGKIRSQISKDYLQIQEKDKSKLFIKTTNAVMGVRGTDFLITTNKQNTATVLFEGEVVFNNLSERGTHSSSKLEDMVDRGVRVMPGEFSVVEKSHPQPTVPAVLNVKQRETLESNSSFDSSRAPSSAEAKTEAKSVVPEGLSGQDVSNQSETIKNEVAKVSNDTNAPMEKDISISDAQGFVSGDKVKPANGSFLHLESGLVVPPAADSIYDPNTKSFVASESNGTVSANGEFVPPKNIEITPDGKIMLSVNTGTEGVKVVEIAPPQPVVSEEVPSLTTVANTIIANPTLITNTSGPIQIADTTSSSPVTQTTGSNNVTGGLDVTTNVIQATRGNLNVIITNP